MTTFEKLIDHLNKISKEMLKAAEGDEDVSLHCLSAQIGSIQQDLKLLLWQELPELNDGEKYEALYKNNDFKFSETFLERHATRQAFWRRVAIRLFTDDNERRKFKKAAEEEFKSATISWREFLWGKKDESTKR